MTDTKQRILDAAERLFADQGYGATSMRQIIGDAGVNLASIHYHFGSKEELLDGVILRKVGPVNEQRLALLDQAITEVQGGRPELEAILQAFLLPVAAGAVGNEQYVRFMGRLFAEGLMPHVVQKHFRAVMGRFVEALRAALPELPEQELLWRFHFMIGALSQTMCGSPQLREAIGLTGDFEERITRLARFLVGGFSAPAGQRELTEVKQ